MGKGLELFVLSVVEDPVNGESIKDIVDTNKGYIQNLLGEQHIFYKALYQKGLTAKNIHDYDNYRFTPNKHVTYDCCAEGFPKLIKDNIPQSINNVKYKMDLSDLDDFLLITEKL